jgi:hypothetical protein
MKIGKTYELENYSRNLRGYFSKMNKIRNDIRFKRADYYLNNSDKTKILKKLDILLGGKNCEESIKTYFDNEIDCSKSLDEKYDIFYKYNKLLEDCYFVSIDQFLNKDIENRFNKIK